MNDVAKTLGGIAVRIAGASAAIYIAVLVIEHLTATVDTIGKVL